jgi:periplasmic divalent cation tolerance protein
MGAPETGVRVVLITAPDAESGARLARTLVEERLAACVNAIAGVRSVYRFEGAVHDEPEVLLVAKTRADRAEALLQRVLAIHPYDVPEVLVLPAVSGSPAYLDWVRAEAAP